MQEPSDIERLWASRRSPNGSSEEALPTPSEEAAPPAGDGSMPPPTTKGEDNTPVDQPSVPQKGSRETLAPKLNFFAHEKSDVSSNHSPGREIPLTDSESMSKSILAGFSLSPLGTAGSLGSAGGAGSLGALGNSDLSGMNAPTPERRPLPYRPASEPRLAPPESAGSPTPTAPNNPPMSDDDFEDIARENQTGVDTASASAETLNSPSEVISSPPPAAKPTSTIEVVPVPSASNSAWQTPPPMQDNYPVVASRTYRPSDEEFLDPDAPQSTEAQSPSSSIFSRFFAKAKTDQTTERPMQPPKGTGKRPWYARTKVWALGGGLAALVIAMQLAGGSADSNATDGAAAGGPDVVANATPPATNAPTKTEPASAPQANHVASSAPEPAFPELSLPPAANDSGFPPIAPPAMHAESTTNGQNSVPAPLPSRLVEQSPDLRKQLGDGGAGDIPRLITVTPSARPPGARRVGNWAPKPEEVKAASAIHIQDVPSLVATGKYLAVIAQVTDEFGNALIDQPVEWSIDRQGTGEIVAVVGEKPQVKPGDKVSALFARGFTAKQDCEVEGMPGIKLRPGDACCLVCSHSPGDMVVTATAPSIPETPKRQAMAKIHWDDARLVLPPPTIASAGSTLRVPIRVANAQGALLSGYRITVHNETPDVAIDSDNSKQEFITDARGEVTLPLRTLSMQPNSAKIHLSLFGNQSYPGKPSVLDEGEVEVRWIDPGFTLQVKHDETVPVRQWSRVEVKLEGTKEVALQPGNLVVLPSRGLEIRSELELDSLPGEKGLLLREISGDAPVTCAFDVESQTPGDRQLRFEVRQGGRVVHSKLITISFSQSSLIVSKEFPKENYVGQPIAYRIVVENRGPFPVSDVILKDELPADFSVARSTATRFRDYLQWNVGTMAPAQRATFDVIATSRAALEPQALRTWVSAENVEENAIHREIEVRGLASLSVALRDQVDPIVPGGETFYRIDVENRGTEPAENVLLSVRSPAEVQFLEADGSLKASTNGGKLVLEPIRVLQPGEKRTCVVRAKGIAEGEARLRIRLEHPSVGPGGIETQESTIVRARSSR